MKNWRQSVKCKCTFRSWLANLLGEISLTVYWKKKMLNLLPAPTIIISSSKRSLNTEVMVDFIDFILITCLLLNVLSLNLEKINIDKTQAHSSYKPFAAFFSSSRRCHRILFVFSFDILPQLFSSFLVLDTFLSDSLFSFLSIYLIYSYKKKKLVWVN